MVGLVRIPGLIIHFAFQDLRPQALQDMERQRQPSLEKARFIVMLLTLFLAQLVFVF